MEFRKRVYDCYFCLYFRNCLSRQPTFMAEFRLVRVSRSPAAAAVPASRVSIAEPGILQNVAHPLFLALLFCFSRCCKPLCRGSPLFLGQVSGGDRSPEAFLSARSCTAGRREGVGATATHPATLKGLGGGMAEEARARHSPSLLTLLFR